MACSGLSRRARVNFGTECPKIKKSRARARARARAIEEDPCTAFIVPYGEC